MVQVECRTDRAVLSMCGRITDESVVDLVSQMRRLADECFYNLIELEITSDGGECPALRHFVDAMAGLRRRGVSVTTRALIKAQSAAAVMLSLGDAREAAAGAALTYHSARAVDLECVTAKCAEALHGSLATTDIWMVERLAERGLRAGGSPQTPCAEAAGGLSGSDWRAVRLLCAALGGAWADGGRFGEDAAATLAGLRRVVGRCARNAAGMKRLYDALFALDTPISAALAKELRLVDSVAASGAPAASPPPAAGLFRIPEWRAAFGPDGGVGRAVLCRHVLILGETGSGKTASGVLPAVGAMFDRRNPFGCALVVDPKREIDGALDALRRMGGVEVRAFEPKPGPDGPTLNLMSGPQWSLDADMEAGRFLTAAQRILVRTGTLAASSPGAMLAGGPGIRHHDPYWPSEGARLGKTALALALMLIRWRREVFAGLDSPGALAASPPALAALRRFGEDAGILLPTPDLDRIARRARDAADGLFEDEDLDELDDEADGASARRALKFTERFVRQVRGARLHRASQAFRSDFERIAQSALAAPSRAGLKTAADLLEAASMRCVDDSSLRPSPNVLALAGRLVRKLFQVGVIKSRDGSSASIRSRLPAAPVAQALRPLADSDEATETLDQIEDYWLPLSRTPNQYTGVLTFGQQCFWEFSDAVPAWTLRFGVEPGAERDGPSGAFDLAAAVEDEERRTAFLIQPRLGGGKDLVAKALKACFFEAVLNSPKRLRRGGEMPLVGYLADECHRFVTSDEVHGEQSFLDTCRSFGAFCVLACQSVSSLEHALAGAGGNAAADGPALSVLLNNAGTKLLFRSTDEATRRRLDDLCPEPSSGAKVTAVRPPSTLRPGECYAVTADGRFERRQLEAFDAERTAARLEAESRPEPGLESAA